MAFMNHPATPTYDDTENHFIIWLHPDLNPLSSPHFISPHKPLNYCLHCICQTYGRMDKCSQILSCLMEAIL